MSHIPPDRASPTVSVIMPVYNGAAHLDESIGSIVNQTFTDLELVAVDDGSQDESGAILARWAEHDARVRVVRHDTNRGHAAASNRAIECASADIIARQDQDDRSRPRRVERTVEYLEAHPGVGVLWSAYVRQRLDGTTVVRETPTTHTAIRAGLVFGNQVCHSSLTFRRSVVPAEEFHYRDLPGPQDYDLLSRVLSHVRGAGLSEALVDYRDPADDGSSMTGRFSAEQAQAVADISNRQLRALVDTPLDSQTTDSLRRLHALRGVEARDYDATPTLFEVFSRLAEQQDLDAQILAETRRGWVRRAIPALLTDPHSARPPLAFVRTIFRHEPVTLARSLARRLPSATRWALRPSAVAKTTSGSTSR